MKTLKRERVRLYAVTPSFAITSETPIGSWSKEETTPSWPGWPRAGEAGHGGPARAGRAPVADHRGHHAAQGRDRRWCSTVLSPKPRNNCSASISSIAPLDEVIDVARDLVAASRRRCEIRPVTVPSPGAARRDRCRLDRCGADLGATPGGRRAAALFPRSRHRRGSVPGSLPARAEELAGERPAARSGRLADHGRPQRGARRRAAAPQAASRCPRTR